MLSLDDLHQTFAPDLIPHQKPDYALEKIPCCWILRRPDDERCIKMNASGLMIWNLCDGQLSVGELIAALKAQFPETPDIEKDIQRTLDELAAQAVIEMRPANA